MGAQARGAAPAVPTAALLLHRVACWVEACDTDLLRWPTAAFVLLSRGWSTWT